LERPRRLLAARLLAADPDDKPRHFSDITLPEICFHQMFIFKLKMENLFNGEN
jgi:hypothetical protein